MKEVTTKGTIHYKVFEELLKGKEQELHDGHFFHDKDGNERKECRIKWWQPIDNRRTYGDVMMACPETIISDPVNSTEFHNYNEEKPVFFGHYWLTGTPILEKPKAICLDYSVAKGGNLVAYRSEYLNTNDMSKGFVFVKSQ